MLVELSSKYEVTELVQRIDRERGKAAAGAIEQDDSFICRVRTAILRPKR